MKRTLGIVLLVGVLGISAVAGEIPGSTTPTPDPPPPPVTNTVTVTNVAVAVIIALLRIR